MKSLTAMRATQNMAPTILLLKNGKKSCSPTKTVAASVTADSAQEATSTRCDQTRYSVSLDKVVKTSTITASAMTISSTGTTMAIPGWNARSMSAQYSPIKNSPASR